MTESYVVFLAVIAGLFGARRMKGADWKAKVTVAGAIGVGLFGLTLSVGQPVAVFFVAFSGFMLVFFLLSGRSKTSGL